ncbi:hypothetical protein THS27_09225 [Thalassospira sp. MCCC 1A01428]|nr:hypothetical protein THS27_09225 [Thalassospira sp. MCCC 1A01428]
MPKRCRPVPKPGGTFVFSPFLTGRYAQKRTRPVGGGSSSRANGAAPSLVWPLLWYPGQGPDTDEWYDFQTGKTDELFNVVAIWRRQRAAPLRGQFW